MTQTITLNSNKAYLGLERIVFLENPHLPSLNNYSILCVCVQNLCTRYYYFFRYKLKILLKQKFIFKKKRKFFKIVQYSFNVLWVFDSESFVAYYYPLEIHPFDSRSYICMPPYKVNVIYFFSKNNDCWIFYVSVWDDVTFTLRS